ncbi:MAG: hypothetical protein COT91_04385 [Candidatus Doudnabacteria bacterium CG10_big_fil_rev_8_21_14_0_10_41_10]|uniref:Uncharacterized protein n=1 Tax=Candidatus Doudnabacteria bacterium CG10_big_fil_rev_8_21_14_0_10_41_10 TaxID=1974551 RepID=A0A2H0VCS6_9BACT|nr:MAG: hypothetical protein COT91_04385 [Candidatus Doudnabacteria bacterium CG10_big_fil_rev_8_21_14_0_10_41_10]
MLKVKIKITTALISAVVLFLGNLFFTLWVVDSGKIGFEKNLGFVFSIPIPLGVVYIISIAVMGILSWIYIFNFIQYNILFSLGFGLIFGGAVSNLYFRLVDGFVYDYFHLGLFGLRGAWNLADIGIVLGILVWIFTSKLKIKSTK